MEKQLQSEKTSKYNEIWTSNRWLFVHTVHALQWAKLERELFCLRPFDINIQEYERMADKYD